MSLKMKYTNKNLFFIAGTSKIKLPDFIQVVLEQMRAMDTEEEIRKVFKVRLLLKNQHRKAMVINTVMCGGCSNYL